MPGRKEASKGRKSCARGVKARAEVVLEETAVAKKPLQPGQCRAYMRRTLAKEFRGIVDGFVEGAKTGSCQHVKLATELLEPRRKGKQEGTARTGRKILSSWLQEIEGGE